MSRPNYNKKEFKKLVSKTPSGFMKRQETTREDRKNKMRSAKLALSILAILDFKKMSQVALAKKMDVTPQQVSKILKGQSNFTFETIDKLEKALGYTVVSVNIIDFEREARKAEFVMKDMTERTIQVKTTKQRAAEHITIKDNFHYRSIFEFNQFNSLSIANDNLRPTGS